MVAFFPGASIKSIEVFRTVPEPDALESFRSASFHGFSVPLKHRSWSVEGGKVRLPAIQYQAFPFSKKGFTILEGGQVSIEKSPRVPESISFQDVEIPAMAIGTDEVTWDEIQKVWPIQLPPSRVSEYAGGVPWDVAVAFAEAQGMTLPSVWELQFVATNAGATQFPKNDTEPDTDLLTPDLEEWDVTNHAPPIRGLLTRMKEWTETPHASLMVDDGVLVPIPGVPKIDGEFPAACLTIGDKIFANSSLQIPFRLRNEKTKELEPDSSLGFRLVRRLR